MPFRFACPECGLETLVDDEYAGQSGPCAGCGKVVTLPYFRDATAAAGTPSAAGSSAPRRASGQWKTIVLLSVSGIAAALFVFSLVIWLFFPVLRGVTGTVQHLSCQTNLTRIAAALKQYEIEHGTLPCAYIPDAAGKPMHSWRVMILPQLGEHGLYSRYRFDEPWDGPNNSALISQMPEIFACPADPDARSKGESSYMVVRGPGTLFPGPTAVSTSRITDDPAMTILVAETPTAGVAWTEPKDLDGTRMKFAVNGAPSSEIGSYHRGSKRGANVVTADGNPRFLSDLFPDDYLQGMTTIRGNEEIFIDDQ